MTYVRQVARQLLAPVIPVVKWRYLGTLLGLQVVMAVEMRGSTLIATACALLVLGGSAAISMTTRRLDVIAAVGGYVAASEVLWRMTNAKVYWEGTEYAVAGILVIALVRLAPRWRGLAAPAIYLMGFVPGAVLSVFALGIGGARQALSFNASPALVLAVAVVFFSQVRFSLAALRLTLWAIVLPVISVAALTTLGTATAAGITFTDESNFITSGGFGPNEVSAVLGFGALAALLLAFTERSIQLRLLEGVLSLWFISEAMLTFSRGGVLNVVVAVVMALLVMLRTLRSSARPILVALALALVGGYIVYPHLNAFTGDKLAVRFSNTSTTGRGNIMLGDLDLFRTNPLVGVGIGVSATEVSQDGLAVTSGQAVAAHTEYTRLLAEQGIFGAVALFALIFIVLRAFRRAPPGVGRVLVASFAGWAFTEMAAAAMRLTLIGFVIGLAVAASGLVSNGDLAGADLAAPALSKTVSPTVHSLG